MQQGPLKSNQTICSAGGTCGVSVKLVSCINRELLCWQDGLFTRQECMHRGESITSHLCLYTFGNTVGVKEEVHVEFDHAFFMSNFFFPPVQSAHCYPQRLWSALIHSHQSLSLCWRQYRTYTSTCRAMAIGMDGDEAVGAHIGDLWKNLETLSGRWETQQQPSFSSEGPWLKSGKRKKTRQSI